MKPEDKWLLIFGSRWVGWDEVFESDYIPLADDLRKDGLLELSTPSYQVRLKPHEIIRV
jgi:hypothetical protein